MMVSSCIADIPSDLVVVVVVVVALVAAVHLEPKPSDVDIAMGTDECIPEHIAEHATKKQIA